MRYAIFAFLLFGVSTHAVEDHRVNGYVKKNGTYVAPHMQTNSDNTQRNNYSAQGNINPYTGKAGTKKPKY